MPTTLPRPVSLFDINTARIQEKSDQPATFRVAAQIGEHPAFKIPLRAKPLQRGLYPGTQVHGVPIGERNHCVARMLPGELRCGVQAKSCAGRLELLTGPRKVLTLRTAIMTGLGYQLAEPVVIVKPVENAV